MEIRLKIARKRHLAENSRILSEWKAKKAFETTAKQENTSKSTPNIAKSREIRLNFLRKQKERIVKVTQLKALRAKEQERVTAAMEQTRILEEISWDKLAHRRKIPQMLEIEKENREKEAKLKLEFERLWENEEIQREIQPFFPSISVIFGYYAKKYAENPLNTGELRLKGFTKLCVDIGLVPDICPKDAMVQLYRQVTKGKDGFEGMTEEELSVVIVRMAGISQAKIALLKNTVWERRERSVGECDPQTVRHLLELLSIPLDPKRMLVRLASLSPL